MTPCFKGHGDSRYSFLATFSANTTPLSLSFADLRLPGNDLRSIGVKNRAAMSKKHVETGFHFLTTPGQDASGSKKIAPSLERNSCMAANGLFAAEPKYEYQQYRQKETIRDHRTLHIDMF